MFREMRRKNQLLSEGHKIDAIKRNDKVSFCVIDKDKVIQETFTTHFRSVVVLAELGF